MLPTRPKQRTIRTRTAIWAVLILTICAPTTHAEPAHFWISLDDSASSGPESPTVTGVLSTPRQVHIWAQPRTTNPGDYNAGLNPYLSLENVSLDVVSPQSTFTVDPNSIEVYNPTYGSLNPRFENLHDGLTGVVMTTNASLLPAGIAAGVLGLQGFTFDPSAADGFGGSCDGSDGYCDSTPAEGDAWLIASMELTPTANTGTIELYLQVGLNGMSHVGEESYDMEVMFGVDTMGAAPAAYDPSTNKQVTLPNDDADAVFTLVKPGDYDADGDVDYDDYTVWHLAYETETSAADGNSDGVVDAEDYTIWRDNLEVGGGAVTAIPEPTTILLVTLLLACATRLRLVLRPHR